MQALTVDQKSDRGGPPTSRPNSSVNSSAIKLPFFPASEVLEVVKSQHELGISRYRQLLAVLLERGLNPSTAGISILGKLVAADVKIE